MATFHPEERYEITVDDSEFTNSHSNNNDSMTLDHSMRIASYCELYY